MMVHYPAFMSSSNDIGRVFDILEERSSFYWPHSMVMSPVGVTIEFL